MNDSELTSRWSFRWLHDGTHSAVRRIEKLAIWASHAPGIVYVEKPGVLRAILIEPAAWKLDSKTWYRQDIRAVLPQITHVDGPRWTCKKLNVLLWSRLPEVVELGQQVRLVTDEEAVKEATLAWHWIGHVVRQPVRVQKKGGLNYTEWLEANPKLTLPESPFSRQSNKPRRSQRIKRTLEFD